MDGSVDEGYSDDDLDALAGEDFLELQEQALQATQQRDAPNQLQHLLLRGRPISQSEVDQVTKESASTAAAEAVVASRPVLPRPDLRAAKGDASPFLGPAGRHVGSRADPSDEVTAREHWRLQRFGGVSSNQQRPEAAWQSKRDIPHRGASQQGPDRLRQEALPSEAAEEHEPVELDVPEENGDLQIAMDQLLLERDQWISEKAELEEAVKQSNRQLQGKAGEIAIIRSNYAKQVQERERVLEDLKRQQRLQDERHRSELEGLRKEKEKLVVQNRFLDHENNERTYHSRPSKKGTRGLAGEDSTATPRRRKAPGFGDGFEDNELELASPSKPPSKPKGGTPKAGAKRKRDIFNHSPATTSFEVAQPENASFSGPKPSPREEARLTATIPYASSADRSEFLHRLLYHRHRHGEARVLEKMATYTFPGQPQISLAERFIDKAPPDSIPEMLDDIPAFYGYVLLDLWSQCLAERYYLPIEAIIDLLRFILLNSTATTGLRLMDEIVSLAQRTADINIIPRFKKLNKNAKVISVHLHDQTLESSEEVDTQQCLELLYMTATQCIRDHDAMTRFWHCMRFDFISMVLRVVQTIDDITLMVQLLDTCVEHDCFGAIKPQSAEGGSAEQHVIDRLSSMLIEIPRPVDDGEPYDTSELLKLRQIILSLMERMCEQELCSQALASHPLAIGRLVRIMNDELNTLYSSQYCYANRVEIINRTIRILFYLTTTFAQEVDLQDKLRRQPGGVNKFLITLSRLAFSDAVWYERGISDDAFDCAHQLLEDFVTPEEAEALKRAFVRDENS